MIQTLLRKTILHDVERLSMSIFRCKRCKKTFKMNDTFRIEVTKKEAIETIKQDEEWKQTLTKYPELLMTMTNVDFYNTQRYIENLSMKQTICWRRR